MPDDKNVAPRFLAIWKEKSSLSEVMKNKRPEFAGEKRVMDEMNALLIKYIAEGIFSGLACFALLRTGPRLISKYLSLRPNQFQQNSGNQSAEKPGLLRRGARLLFDSFVSLNIGYAVYQLTDKTEFFDKQGTFPLVEGRSLLSEELCPALAKEFQKTDRQIWNSKHHSLTGGDVRDLGRDSVNILGFVANCKRREIYEKQIRAEQGLGVDDPIIIPTPGVPRDISVTLDDLLSTKESGDDDASAADNGDDFFDMNFDSVDEGEGDFKD